VIGEEGEQRDESRERGGEGEAGGEVIGEWIMEDG